MDESDWLAATDPQAMLASLLGMRLLSGRRARLFAAACCRRVWHLLQDDRSRRAVEVVEAHADGLAGEGERTGVEAAANEAARASPAGHPWFAAAAAKMTAARSVPVPKVAAHTPARAVNRPDEVRANNREQAHLLRDLFGNRPSRTRPVVAEAVLAWEGGTVARLTQAAYEERLLPAGHLHPARLAVLADALEEAGADSELVGHLRGPGPHVRGCWAVDLVLGKE